MMPFLSNEPEEDKEDERMEDGSFDGNDGCSKVGSEVG
jgi:hypothetical protein